MHKIIARTYLKQCRRFVSSSMKQYGSYIIMGVLVSVALLFSMSIILENMLGEMLEIILVDGTVDMRISLLKTLIFSGYCIVLVSYLIALVFGFTKQSQFDKMLRNYGVSLFQRNVLSSLGRTLTLSLVSIIMTTSLLGMSMRHLDYEMIQTLVLGLIIQIPLTLFILETLYPTIYTILFAFGPTVSVGLLVTIVGIYSWFSYSNSEFWQLSSYWIDLNLFGLIILIVFIVWYLFIQSFDYRKSTSGGRILFGRIIPTTLMGKVMKEMLRHKEAQLNMSLMILVCGLIKVYKPTLLYSPMNASLMLMMPCMQAIYTYSQFDQCLFLLRRTKLSSMRVYMEHFVGCILVVVFQMALLMMIEPYLRDGLSLSLGLAMVFFMLVGKYFPLNDQKQFNSTIVIVVLMLAIIPTILLVLELKRMFELTSLEMSLLMIVCITVMKGATLRSVSHSLSR